MASVLPGLLKMSTSGTKVAHTIGQGIAKTEARALQTASKYSANAIQKAIDAQKLKIMKGTAAGYKIRDFFGINPKRFMARKKEEVLKAEEKIRKQAFVLSGLQTPVAAAAEKWKAQTAKK
jgi:hypothetical protein